MKGSYDETDLEDIHTDLETIAESLKRIEENQYSIIEKIGDYMLGLLFALFIIAVLIYKI